MFYQMDKRSKGETRRILYLLAEKRKTESKSGWIEKTFCGIGKDWPHLKRKVTVVTKGGMDRTFYELGAT